MNKVRFEAFTDGVFAFAITLLVLGFALPELHNPSDRELMAALLKLWPNLIAYVLSFGVIGIMWQNHHALFRKASRVDRKTIFLNLLAIGGHHIYSICHKYAWFISDDARCDIPLRRNTDVDSDGLQPHAYAFGSVKWVS